MSGPIRRTTARCPTTGCRCSAARPGPTSRRGGNTTTTNSCASSPSSTGATTAAREAALDGAGSVAGARRRRLSPRCRQRLSPRRDAGGQSARSRWRSAHRRDLGRTPRTCSATSTTPTWPRTSRCCDVIRRRVEKHSRTASCSANSPKSSSAPAPICRRRGAACRLHLRAAACAATGAGFRAEEHLRRWRAIPDHWPCVSLLQP